MRSPGLSSLLERVAALEAEARRPSDWLALADLYSQTETCDPLDHRLPANRGNALWLADCPQEALHAYWRAAQLAPSDPVVLRGLGNVQLDLNAFELAEQAYARSMQLDPAALTAWNRSQVLIGLERYPEGYAQAEERWRIPSHRPWRELAAGGVTTLDQLQEPLLVWSEQGLGDTLQHLRWLGPLQAQRGPEAPLVLELEPCLVPLFRQALPSHLGSLEIRAKPDGPAPPWPHRHISLLSLPWLLKGAPIPAGATWLDAANWSPSRPLSEGRPARIGLVWAAGRKLDHPVTAREYHRRSLDQRALGSLLEGLHSLGVVIVPLQFGEEQAQVDPWRRLLSQGLAADADFATTAALVADLDLVLSVDTSMAHLVGAMRRRGWLLLPHAAAPRWLRTRPDSPWYPSLRLFRQPRTGDWQGVVDAVIAALASELEGRMC